MLAFRTVQVERKKVEIRWGHAELDLLVHFEGQRLGFEFKYTEAPKISKSMRIALQDLRLDALVIVCPGAAAFPLDDKIRVQGLSLWTHPPKAHSSMI